jgi:hypothetical protein
MRLAYDLLELLQHLRLRPVYRHTEQSAELFEAIGVENLVPVGLFRSGDALVVGLAALA